MKNYRNISIEGFTLIEVVMVMILVSILSVVIVEKTQLFKNWDSTAEAKSIYSVLASAQSIAIANRKTVYISVSSSALKACYDVACSQPVNNLKETLTLNFTKAPSGTMSSFSFDSNGLPSFTGIQSLSLENVTVQVESATGLIWSS